MCSKGHKELSAELDRMTNVGAAYLDKFLKHEKLASEAKARCYAPVAAKAMVEKRIEDDRELKTRSEEQSKEEEAELDNAALPEEALQEIANLKTERETPEKALNSYQGKLADIISKGKAKLKEEHKDGGPAKKAQQAAARAGEAKEDDVMEGTARDGAGSSFENLPLPQLPQPRLKRHRREPGAKN